MGLLTYTHGNLETMLCYLFPLSSLVNELSRSGNMIKWYYKKFAYKCFSI